jgi:hypothetical protein
MLLSRQRSAWRHDRPSRSAGARGPGGAPPRSKDRRGKLIVLTDPGKRLIDEAIGRHIANEERLLLSLTQAEQETLDALLRKLIAGL